MTAPLYYVQKSLRSLNSLIKDVEEATYIPPKFRAEPFTEELRLDYLAYLFRERARLERMVKVREAPANVAG